MPTFSSLANGLIEKQNLRVKGSFGPAVAVHRNIAISNQISLAHFSKLPFAGRAGVSMRGDAPTQAELKLFKLAQPP